jgi:xanthine dehydrogenase accessory factor
MCTAVVVIRGGGDIGTGVALRLFNSGFEVVITEIENPRVIRREVAFATAVYNGSMTLEGVRGVKANTLDDVSNLLKDHTIPVVVDSECSVVAALPADVLVDALLAKKNRGMRMDMAPLTIGLGPGFEAGRDVHIVIETNRGHNLGRVLREGCAQPNTAVPEAVNGYGKERVLRAPCDGVVKNSLNIGDQVKVDETVCYVGEAEVRSAISGVVRGIIMNGVEVTRGLKIGDIDPRGIGEYCFTVSDKARAIGGGVLEAILSVRQGITVP